MWHPEIWCVSHFDSAACTSLFLLTSLKNLRPEIAVSGFYTVVHLKLSMIKGIEQTEIVSSSSHSSQGSYLHMDHVKEDQALYHVETGCTCFGYLLNFHLPFSEKHLLRTPGILISNVLSPGERDYNCYF